MPTPRRSISLLAQDAAGTVPVASPRISRERYAREARRCHRCRCVLAQDNYEAYCSPCQRRINLNIYQSDRYSTTKP